MPAKNKTLPVLLCMVLPLPGCGTLPQLAGVGALCWLAAGAPTGKEMFLPIDPKAEKKYRECLRQVEREEDRDRRIALLLSAKAELSGTLSGHKAEKAWKREKKRKQNDLDRAARRVYQAARAQCRADPSDYDDNIRFLAEAARRVTDSPRYEREIQRLIEREKARKAGAQLRH